MALAASKSETYTKKIVNTLHWNVSGVNILQYLVWIEIWQKKIIIILVGTKNCEEIYNF